jgi:hypothetical protein
MSRTPTSPHDALQLHKLRILRVTRAREHCANAGKEVAAAEIAVEHRERLIRASRCAIGSLAQAVVTSLAPHLPRWNGTVHAARARLSDQLERDEDALIGESRRLEASRQAAEQARVELARAIAREDVVRDLAQQARHARDLDAEQRAETEQEDQGRGANPRARSC